MKTDREKEAMTKFSEVRAGDTVTVVNRESQLTVSGIVAGHTYYGKFTEIHGGTETAIRFVGQETVAYPEGKYLISEWHPIHRYPEVGKAIKMWNGKTPNMAKMTKSVGYWDGQKYLGHKFDESVGLAVEVCWDSAVCPDTLMEAIEWEYIGE